LIRRNFLSILGRKVVMDIHGKASETWGCTHTTSSITSAGLDWFSYESFQASLWCQFFCRLFQESSTIWVNHKMVKLFWGQFHQHFTRDFFANISFWHKKAQNRTVIREKLCNLLSYKKYERKILLKSTPERLQKWLFQLQIIYSYKIYQAVKLPSSCSPSEGQNQLW
jgi:hypothetical protein